MIRKPTRWFFISLSTILVGIAIIIFVRPLLGIDFTGGALIEASLPSPEPSGVREAIDAVLQEHNLPSNTQTTQDKTVLIRTIPLDETQHQEIVKSLKEKSLITEELRYESIGPTIGQELKRSTAIAAVLALIAIIVYLAYTFRRMGGFISPWKFGVSAAYALFHDIVVIVALFVILGKVYNVPIDTMFVSAILAIAGYSVNDTIVVFSRLREEWGSLSSRLPLKDLLRHSIMATLIRSLNTSLATVLVLIALFILGGATIQWFIVALIAGIATGTYSSIFVASPCLYMLSRQKG